MKHVWVIGGSEGIGLEVARQLRAADMDVTVSARNKARLQQLKLTDDLAVASMDASDADQVKTTVNDLYATSSSAPDTVLINVGDYDPMPIEEFSSKLFRRLIDINYMAHVQVLEHLLPAMRNAGGGTIWLNASLAAYRGLPKSAPYSASKAALLSLVECLIPEAEQWNIKIGVINHGFVRTRLTAKNDFAMPMLLEPEQAATYIINGMQKKRYEIAFPWLFVYWMKTLRLLPYMLYFAITRRMVA